ncbi:MAG TPA: sulfatase-like hydrolase/transferase [Candidatus Krumholzibacteria bacterium]|nr:sulfatase-like hydrolase/transferase [Candidatus Krumholzibacteria bacterium]HPD72354.1 sulfatase-like hydrolase/transferase [Candidatus Krumholzibacteria bacterium]HRY40714.1 sulfatase-like hydrolase/transferase [Candidatus Krumholzibacteria bacterium]
MAGIIDGIRRAFGGGQPRPNNVVFVVFDSCRWDAYEAARTPNLDRIGRAERRYSYASWTSPSHYTFLMGMVPHLSPKGVFASNVYREEFAAWSQRLGIPDVEFKKFVPELSLVAFLKAAGYWCEGWVSLPVLNPRTSLSAHFDRYELAPSHNDLQAILDRLEFRPDQPTFFFINTGETHYPYLLPGETAADLPHLSGVHGIFKSLDEFLKNPGEFVKDRHEDEFFTPSQFQAFRAKQVACVEHLDAVMGRFFERCPANTYFLIMSDHGELFGEDGYFGHGPIFHEKVFEVFYLEGQRP